MTSPAPAHDDDVAAKYRRSRRTSIILGALAVLLALVVIVQLTSGSGSPTAGEPTSPPAGTAASTPTDGPTPSPTPTSASEPAAPTAAPETGAEPEPVRVERRDPDDPMAIGDVDAPVVLVEWLDMRCPYCAMFGRETFPTLVEEYVETGQVRIELRDAALFGPESELAAVAARAAGNQGLYLEYVEAVFAVAPESGQPELPRAALVAFAEQIGVPDMDRFDTDLDDPGLLAAVRDATAEAQRLGVDSVPFFVVGRTAMAGALPIDTFRDFLDNALAEVG